MVCTYTEYQIDEAKKYLESHWVVGFDGSCAATEDDAVQWLDAGSPEGWAVDTYEIPVVNLENATKKLDALRRKCVKLNSPDIAWRYGPRHPRYGYTWTDYNGQEHAGYTRDQDRLDLTYTGLVVEYIQVQVRGDAPSLSGWKFLATLSPIQQEDGTWVNLILKAPAVETDLNQYRECVGQCDHCNSRRRRSKTYLVQNEQGEIKSVGATCVKDFLGYNSDPSSVVARLQLLDDLGATFRSLQQFNPMEGKDAWSLEFFLTQTIKQIGLTGWVSKTSAQESGRASTVELLGNRLAEERRYPETKVPITEDETAEAKAIIAWFKTFDETSDYILNLRAVVGSGMVGYKTAGLAASLVSLYRRETQKAQEQKQKVESAKPSGHVGAEGERVVLTVTVESVRGHEGYYGETGIHRMRDQDGNILVWFASAGTEWLDLGEHRIKATVKKHDEYKGVKQTVLSRVFKL